MAVERKYQVVDVRKNYDTPGCSYNRGTVEAGRWSTLRIAILRAIQPERTEEYFRSSGILIGRLIENPNQPATLSTVKERPSYVGSSQLSIKEQLDANIL